jgi:hypothetical protein
MKDGSFTFFYFEPVLAECFDDVGLMGDKDRVSAGLRRHAEHLAKGFCAAAVFVRRHDEATFGEVRRLLDALEAREQGGFIGPIELAGINLADRNADLTESAAEGGGQRFALVVEVSLGGDILLF